MIIKCPNCGFSGRVPEHATRAPHQARCPKCHFRFDVGDLSLPIPEPVAAVGQSDLRRDSIRSQLDPSDSSYHLDPLADDFAAEGWDGSWSHDPDGPMIPTAGVRVGFGRRSRVPAWALRPSVWRIRLFQGWAVLFLAVAALILLRTTIAAITFDDARFFSNDLLRPIAAVVLLVVAAALLCLSVDVSRRLARSTYAPHAPRPIPARE